MKKIARNLNDAVTEYIQQSGKIPSNEELSKLMGISMETLEKMLEKIEQDGAALRAPAA